jgi:hypothetical protein
MTTKQQEREALARIREIVEGLGESSYVGTAFEGVLEDAEDNISNNIRFSARGLPKIEINALKENKADRDAALEAKAAAETRAKELIDKLTTNFILDALHVNDCADGKDANRNHVNYGCVTRCAHVLRLLGQEIEIACWEDNGYLRISKYTINGKTTELH